VSFTKGIRAERQINLVRKVKEESFLGAWKRWLLSDAKDNQNKQFDIRQDSIIRRTTGTSKIDADIKILCTRNES